MRNYFGYLWHVLELGYGVWVADKCKARANGYDFVHFLVRFVRQVAQNGEDCNATEKAGHRVHKANNHGVPVITRMKGALSDCFADNLVAFLSNNKPVYVLSETVVAGEHDNRTETNGEWEEALAHCSVPSLWVP